jgi:hypothetical protein
MPVPARFKQVLEVALKDIVRNGAIPWDKLKPRLVSYGIAKEGLEEYRQDILNMFLEFLEAAKNKHSRSPSKTAQNRSPPSSRSPSVSSDESSVVRHNRQAKSTKDRAREPEDGWVRPAEISDQKKIPKLVVTLSFGSKKENIIGAHIIKRYEKRYERRLAHQDKDDIVELVCGLNSRPGRTYDIKFRVEEDADFDILLGKYWQGDDLDETRNSKSRKSRIERESHVETKTVPADLAESNSSLSSFSTSPLTANRNSAFRALETMSDKEVAQFTRRILTEVTHTGGSRSISDVKRSKRRQDKQPGFGTDSERPRIRKATKGGARTSPADSLTDASLGQERAGHRMASSVRKGAPRKSDASATSDEVSAVFDTQDQSDEPQETSVSSPDPASDDQAGSKSRLSDSFIQEIDECFYR